MRLESYPGEHSCPLYDPWLAVVEQEPAVVAVVPFAWTLAVVLSHIFRMNNRHDQSDPGEHYCRDLFLTYNSLFVLFLYLN
jgi:hypothetical protein